MFPVRVKNDDVGATRKKKRPDTPKQKEAQEKQLPPTNNHQSNRLEISKFEKDKEKGEKHVLTWYWQDKTRKESRK